MLSWRELERIRADVHFVTTKNPTKDGVRQRLQYYRALDIASEEADYIPAASENGHQTEDE